MQVFIDLDLRQIVASSVSKSPLASVWVKAQDTVSLSVYFVQSNAIVNPGSGVAASMMFGMVSQGTPSTILSLTTSFTLQTDGSSNPYYLGLLNLNTVPMATAISACKTTALACSAEFRYQLPDGEIFHSFNTTFQVYPSLLAESGVTQPANVATYPASSAIELVAHKNVASGYAGLNSSSKLTGSQIPIDGTTITLVGGVLVASPYTDPQTALNTADITSLQTSRTADESDITSLKASRTTDEAAILSNTGRLTSLETSRTADEATIAAQTTSINSLDSSRTTDETNISANSSAITALQARRLDQFAAPNVDLSLASHKLTNVSTPTAGTDAANKTYVDAVTIPESQVTGLVADLAGKLATTGTITESQVTNLVSDLAGKLSTSGTITESQVTNLVTDLGTLTTNIATNGTAITGLQARRLDQFAAPNTDLSIGSHKLTNVTTPSATTDAANKAYVDAVTIPESQVTNLVSDLAGKLSTTGTITESQVTGLVTDLGTLTTNVSTNSSAITALQGRRLDQFAAPNVDLSIGSHKLTNVTTPSATTDAANKAYVDAVTIPESQVTNLVSDLAGKLSTSGTIAESQVTGLVTDLGTLTTNVSTNSSAITALQGRRLDQFAAPNVDLSIGSHKLTNVSTPTATTDAANKAYVDAVTIPESQVTSLVSDLAGKYANTTRLDQITAPTSSVSLNSQKITGLATPTTGTDASTKAYVDAVTIPESQVTNLVSDLASHTSTLSSHTTSIASLNAGSATRGAWSTQAIDSGATVRLEDEFCINDASGTAFSGNLQWVKVIATSGAVAQSASIPNASTYAYVGANFFTPTATIASAGALTLKGTGVFQSKSYIDHAFRTFMTVLPTSAQNVTILIGLTTSTNADLTGTFFGFEFNPVVSNNWQFTTGTASGSPTRVDLGSNYVATTNASWLRLQQTEVTWQTINVSINGAFSTPLTSGIASDTSNLYYPCMKVVRTVAGATAINVYIDTWRALITTSR